MSWRRWISYSHRKVSRSPNSSDSRAPSFFLHALGMVTGSRNAASDVVGAFRNKLVQRYWMGENVGLLPFTDEKLAASVGKTAAEIDAMPINPLAADVVFDALSTSNAGILARSVCDEQRASFQDADGSFNERKFSDDLFRGKLKGDSLFLHLSRHYLPASSWPLLQARRLACDGGVGQPIPRYHPACVLWNSALSGKERVVYLPGLRAWSVAVYRSPSFVLL